VLLQYKFPCGGMNVWWHCRIMNASVSVQ
jgi:hypothetical protein